MSETRRIRRILVAVKDPWARSLPAVDKAAQLGRALGASLHLFHARTDPFYVDVADVHGQDLIDLERKGLSKPLQGLERIARRVGNRGMSADAEVQWDYPAHEAVIRAARRFAADLIVAERHSVSHHLPWLLRFTDFELLRLSTTPVLLVKSGRSYLRPRILAAVDPGHSFAKPRELDREILGYASILAQALRGSLHAVYAFDPLPIEALPTDVSLGEVAAEIERTAEQDARKAFDRALSHAGIPQSRRHMTALHPSDAIESVARQIDSSIVAMGSVSRSGLKRAVIGNTAERVLDHLACDILVVKPGSFRSQVPRARRGIRLVALPTLQPGI